MKDKKKININLGCSGTTILQIVFIILKLTKVIKWKWVWVLSPIWISIALAILVFIVVFLITLISALRNKI